jgi:hypothetical protein
MNATAFKYTFVLCLSIVISGLLMLFGGSQKSDVFYQAIILFIHGGLCLNIVKFMDWLSRKK